MQPKVKFCQSKLTICSRRKIWKKDGELCIFMSTKITVFENVTIDSIESRMWQNRFIHSRIPPSVHPSIHVVSTSHVASRHVWKKNKETKKHKRTRKIHQKWTHSLLLSCFLLLLFFFFFFREKTIQHITVSQRPHPFLFTHSPSSFTPTFLFLTSSLSIPTNTTKGFFVDLFTVT